MEILFLIGGWFVLKAIFSGLSSGGSSYDSMGSFRSKVETRTVELQGKDITVYDVMVKGLIPVSRSSDIALAISAFDTTTDELRPVISIIKDMSEPASRVYQSWQEAGIVKINEGWNKWICAGTFIPELSIFPESGERSLTFVTRVMHSNHRNLINIGHVDYEKIIADTEATVNLSVVGRGYIEAAEDREKVYAQTIKLAVCVAMSDGVFDDSEGEVIKNWMMRVIDFSPEGKRANLKRKLNRSFSTAHEQASAGKLSFSVITKALNKISDNSERFEAVELCMDVMAADGVADEKELEVIANIADALGLDFAEIEKMKDQRLISLQSSAQDNTSMETLLGIKPEWSSSEIKSHLRNAFKKWNGRTQSLTDETEKQQAQKMLDLIAEARNKYS